MSAFEPQWYKDAVIYEVRVGAFFDGNGDGIGDFKGLTAKLDYLKDLGVTTLWLLPFFPSPQRDDGYDIADYEGIGEHAGTINEFKILLKEAHKRGMKMIIELVLNHTSDQHKWFQRARLAPPGSPERNFYVWSDTNQKYPEARIIFKDFEQSNWTWDETAKAYYWHRFFSHQPDLNFDSPDVQKAMFDVLDHWMALGIDGFRLDAVPYLYERDGTNGENLSETHEYLKKLRKHVDVKYPGRMLLAEANQWPEDAVHYFGAGDECHMAFHFPIMPRLFMSIYMEDRVPVIDILQQTPNIPENCQWAVFLRNHDELTLEMVTDEERDYMYRVYATDPQARINLGIRRRLAPLLGNNRRKMELMNGLLFSLPGTPVIYYGDELGMGDNFYLGDRNGVRTPMQWSPGANAGFSTAPADKLYLPIVTSPEYHYETINVESQLSNPHSLLMWTRRLIALRKKYKAFSRGGIDFLAPDNRKVLAYVRKFGDETVLVVANLSRYVQYAELNLSAYKDLVPMEMFGRTDFPKIGEAPYMLSLGPHSFYWFLLKSSSTTVVSLPSERTLPTLEVETAWDEIFNDEEVDALEKLIPSFMAANVWYLGRAERIRSTDVKSIIKIQREGRSFYWLLVAVDYFGESSDLYSLPLSFLSEADEVKIPNLPPHKIVANIKGAQTGWLVDGMADPNFCLALLDYFNGKNISQGGPLEIGANLFKTQLGMFKTGEDLTPQALKGDQHNTSVRFGEKFVFKLFRRLGEGVHPEAEMGEFLTSKNFTGAPAVAGELRLKTGKSYMSMGILQQFVPNIADAWEYTAGELRRFYDLVLAQPPLKEGDALPPVALDELLKEEPAAEIAEKIGTYLDLAAQIGARTADFHAAVGSDGANGGFNPEPFTKLSLRASYQSMRSAVLGAMAMLRQYLPQLPEDQRAPAQKILELEPAILKMLEQISQLKIHAKVVRCHNDYHLGQLLYTGKEFILIDFEGEPTRPLSERRIKKSPLRDVTAMLRSFHYAAEASLLQLVKNGEIPADKVERCAVWARVWRSSVSAKFMQAYLRHIAPDLIPADSKELQAMLYWHLLERALTELVYDIQNRPRFVKIPLAGVFELFSLVKP